MWPPSIAIVELVLFVAVAGLALVFAGLRARWMLGVVPCFAVGVLATPTDAGSSLAVGGLLSTIYVMAVLISKWLVREPRE